MLGPEIVAFLEEQAVRPKAIFSKYDFNSASLAGRLGENVRVDSMLRESGIEDAGRRETLKRAFRAATSLPDMALEAEGLVALPDPNGKNASLLSSMARMPVDSFDPVVETLNRKDLLTYSLFHEAAHTRPEQMHMSAQEMRENDSDLIANGLYARAYERGLVSDVRVPEFVSYARALGVVMSGNNISPYTFSGTIDPDETTNWVLSGNPETRFWAINNALVDVYRSIGSEHDSSRIRFYALGEIEGNGFLSGSQRDRFEELSRSGEDAPLSDIKSFLAELEIPGEVQPRYAMAIRDAMINEGVRMVTEQPGLLYESLKSNLLRGDYDYDAGLKTQMQNAVLGMENLASNHFGIEGAPYTRYLRQSGENLTSGLAPKSLRVAPSFGGITP